MIKVNGLCKTFGSKKALNEISFEVNEGDIIGIIGHNGAGKSTLINCMIDIVKPDLGHVSFGFESKDIYKNIGVQMQQNHFEDRAKVIDVCNLYKKITGSHVYVDELLSDFDLLKEKETFIKTLSGGTKQRLSVLLTMINHPKIIFLDELTTGLDPAARRSVWEILKRINKKYNITILLTSHFLDEIEYLSDKIIILNKGNLIYHGTVSDIIEQHTQNEKLIMFKLKDGKSEALLSKYNYSIGDSNNYTIRTSNGEEMLKHLLIDVGIEDLVVKEPNFEDVFLNMLGYKLNKDGGMIND